MSINKTLTLLVNIANQFKFFHITTSYKYQVDFCDMRQSDGKQDDSGFDSHLGETICFI